MSTKKNTIESAAASAIMNAPTATAAALDSIMNEPVVGPLPAGIHTVQVQDIRPVQTAKGAMLIMKVHSTQTDADHNITLWIGATPEEKSMFDTTKYYLLQQAECQTLQELLNKKAELQVLGVPSTKDPRYTNYSFSRKFIEEYQA